MAENKSRSFWQCKLDDPIGRLTNMRKRNLFTDCKFEVEGKIFEAHRTVLAMSSPVFEAMFFGSFPQDNNENPISIDDLDAATFEFFLKYIYENYTEIDSLEGASKVLYAARKYMLDSLEKHCASSLGCIVNCKSVFEVYKLASKYDIKRLKDSCEKVIKKQTYDVLLYCDYKRIGIEHLLFILKQPVLNCSELELFAAIEEFVKANNIPIGDDGISALCTSTLKNKRRKISSNNSVGIKDEEISQIFDAVKSIRFLTMTASVFANGPASSKLLSDKEKLAVLVSLASPVAKQSLPEGFSTARETRYSEDSLDYESLDTSMSSDSI